MLERSAASLPDSMLFVCELIRCMKMLSGMKVART